MIIQRDSYLNQLIASMGNGMIKVITGLRRSGKSFLLFELFDRYLRSIGVEDDHIIRFAFDSPDFLKLIGDDPINLALRKKKADPFKFNDYIESRATSGGTYYLLLDEVQLLDSFETVLNGFLGHGNFDVYATGSNAKFLSKDIITEFRGRGWQIHVYPLSFGEYKQARGGSNEEAYAEYVAYGGLPKILDFKTEAEKVRYLKGIFDETYIKDIIDRNKVKNADDLNELLDFLASSIGSLTNPTKLANTFMSEKHAKIHQATIVKFIDYFADSFLLSEAKRYDIKGKRYINTPFKYYFSDLGLRNARLNFREFEQPRLMENVIYNELVKRGYNVDVGALELYEKNRQGKSVLKNTEVDFVCNRFDKRIYIQAAYAIDGDEKLRQEQKSLLHIPDAFKKVIIVKDALRPHYNQDGIYIVGLYDFLLSEDSLG